MKLVKMAGLAALVALAAMAVSGIAASAAQAVPTQLCQENVAICPAGSIKPEGTKIKAKLPSGTQLVQKFETSDQAIHKIYCSESEVSGKTGAHVKDHENSPLSITEFPHPLQFHRVGP